MISTVSVQPRRCQCRIVKIIRNNDESPQLEAVETFMKEGAHIDAFVVLKLCSAYPDFKCLNYLLETMIGLDARHVLPDKKFLPLAHAHCDSFLRLHPPCEFHTYESYLELLKNNFLPLLKKMNTELKLEAENVLPDKHARHNYRRRFTEDDISGMAWAIEELTAYEEKIFKKYSDLFPWERLQRLFVPFTFMVNIIEKDMLLRSASPQGNRSRPLIVELLWGGAALDAESVRNDGTRRIFDFYSDCWHHRVKDSHRKAFAKLIEVMSNAARLSDNLNRSTHLEGLNNPDPETLRFRGFSCRPLNEIENGTRKIRRRSVVDNSLWNSLGSTCSCFVSLLATSLKNCPCKKGCESLADSLLLLQPVWLRLHVTCQLLKMEPTVEAMIRSVEAELSELSTGRNSVSEFTSDLRSIYLSAAEETFFKIWSKTIRIRKVGSFPKRAKLETENLSKEELEIDRLMNSLKDLKFRKTTILKSSA